MTEGITYSSQRTVIIKHLSPIFKYVLVNVVTVKCDSVPLILTSCEKSCHMDQMDTIQYPGTQNFSRLSLILGHFPRSTGCKM